MFVAPFFYLVMADLETKREKSSKYGVIAWGMIGALVMYCFEIMAMKVDGVKNYFSDGWNYID